MDLELPEAQANVDPTRGGNGALARRLAAVLGPDGAPVEVQALGIPVAVAVAEQGWAAVVAVCAPADRARLLQRAWTGVEVGRPPDGEKEFAVLLQATLEAARIEPNALLDLADRGGVAMPCPSKNLDPWLGELCRKALDNDAATSLIDVVHGALEGQLGRDLRLRELGAAWKAHQRAEDAEARRRIDAEVDRRSGVHQPVVHNVYNFSGNFDHTNVAVGDNAVQTVHGAPLPSADPVAAARQTVHGPPLLSADPVAAARQADSALDEGWLLVERPSALAWSRALRIGVVVLAGLGARAGDPDDGRVLAQAAEARELIGRAAGRIRLARAGGYGLVAWLVTVLVSLGVPCARRASPPSGPWSDPGRGRRCRARWPAA